MTEELEVLLDVARRLDGARIPYMATGSIATNFYAVPRMTRDIDIVVELGQKDLGRVIPLLEADFYLDPQTEEYWCAGWMHNLEYTLWDVVSGKRADICKPEEMSRSSISRENAADGSFGVSRRKAKSSSRCGTG